MQSGDGGVWEGVPHPFGWDVLERLESDSIEPMDAVRTGEGWWVLGIEGHLISMNEVPTDEPENQPLTQRMNLVICLFCVRPMRWPQRPERAW